MNQTTGRRIPPPMAHPSDTPPTPTPTPSIPELDVPSGLASDVRSWSGVGRSSVPAHVDIEVLTIARKTAMRRVWQRRMLLAGPLAAAAGLALAVWMWPGMHSAQRSGPIAQSERVVGPAGDVNGDGTVDMRDALALAQRIQRGGTATSDDQNSDGVIDSADVDAVAMVAVRLDHMTHNAARTGGES